MMSVSNDLGARTSSPSTATPSPSRFTTAPLLLVMTPRSLLTDIMERERLRLMPRLVTMDTPPVLSARSMWRGSATRFPSSTSARSLGPCARLLLTPPMLRSVRTPSPPSAARPTPRSTTAPLLLVMTPTWSLTATDTARERLSPQVPQHVERKVPRAVCHSEPRQQCHQSAHKVPRRVCAHYYDDKKNNKDNRKNRGYGYGRY